MAQVQSEIDSIRAVATSLDEAQPDSEEDIDSHVPIFMSQQQGGDSSKQTSRAT